MDQNMDNSSPSPEDSPQPNEAQTPPEAEAAEPQPSEMPAAAQPEPSPSDEINKDAKMWAMFCHLAGLAMFTSIPFANIIGPLIIWLIKKDDFTFVDDQGKEALNFQISIAIYALISAVTLCFPPLFGLLIAALMIVNVVFIIIASIESNKGNAYRYPMSLRLVK